jgi:hypothetical protein
MQTVNKGDKKLGIKKGVDGCPHMICENAKLQTHYFKQRIFSSPKHPH